MNNKLYNDTATLIVAAGDGTRLGGQPKALIKAGNKTLIEHVTEAVSEISAQVIIGVRAVDVDQVTALLPNNIVVTAGGATRQETVQRLLDLAEKPMVMIHDVARPFTTQSLYRSVLEAAFEHGGATPVLPASTSDSVAMADGDWLGSPLPRDKVVRTQTPYAFTRESLIDAMQQAVESGWEDTTVTALLTRAGYRVRLVPGDEGNVKITYPEDLEAARSYFSENS